MNTVKIEKINTKMVAHRGLSGIEKENTNSAFVAAGNRSYYGIETDIHRTADGRFAVVHDSSLKRVAGENIPVEEVSMQTLSRTVLIDKDGSRDRADLTVPTLENYVSICKKYEKHCVLELKSDFTDAEIEEIVRIIDSYSYLEGVTFISFIYDNLKRIRKVLPTSRVQFLFTEMTGEIKARLISDGFDVDIYHENLTRELIDELHGEGIEVNCWTVDSKEKAEQLCEWGVDYITSNVLE